MHVTKTFRMAAIVIAVHAQFLILGSAQATAVLNIVDDQFCLDAQSIWGIDYMSPFPPEKPVGTVEADRFTGSLLSNASVSHVIGNNTNVAGSTTRISSHIRESDFTVHLQSNVELGSGLSRSAWNLHFDIMGAGAVFSVSDEFSACTLSDYNDIDLLDITSGLLYGDLSFHSTVSLLDGHSYILSAESVQAGPRTGASLLEVRFDDVHLHVPEPGTVALLLSGLFTLGFRRTTQAKKSPQKRACKTEDGSPYYLLAISSNCLAGMTWPLRAASAALRPKATLIRVE